MSTRFIPSPPEDGQLLHDHYVIQHTVTRIPSLMQRLLDLHLCRALEREGSGFLALSLNIQSDVLRQLLRLSCLLDGDVLQSLSLLRQELEHGGLELEDLVLYLAVLEEGLLIARRSLDGRVEDAGLGVVADTVDGAPEVDVFLRDFGEVVDVDGAILGQLGQGFCLRVTGLAGRDGETGMRLEIGCC